MRRARPAEVIKIDFDKNKYYMWWVRYEKKVDVEVILRVRSSTLCAALSERKDETER